MSSVVAVGLPPASNAGGESNHTMCAGSSSEIVCVRQEETAAWNGSRTPSSNRHSEVKTALVVEECETEHELIGTTGLSGGTSSSSSSNTDVVLMPSPAELMTELPLSALGEQTVRKGREAVKNILRGLDTRIMVVVGPCSIHHPKAALEYGKALKEIHRSYTKELFLVMRTYYEKPRTQEGWKGLVRDPGLDDSGDILLGLKETRKLLISLLDSGIPCGAEILDPFVAPYVADLLVWGAVGARTTESQVHRDLACTLGDIPIGFKNGTAGDVSGAIDSCMAASYGRTLLAIDQQSGRLVSKRLVGRSDTHVVLRGGRHGPNYSLEHVGGVVKHLLHHCTELPKSQQHKPSRRIVIDCSHGNTGKDYTRQATVAGDIAKRIGNDDPMDGRCIAGLMLESFLKAGRQDMHMGSSKKEELEYGVSITDSCIDLPTTSQILDTVATACRQRPLRTPNER